MSSQKHPMSIYTVMLILSMIFMLLANIFMISEWLRWRDTGATTAYVTTSTKLLS